MKSESRPALGNSHPLRDYFHQQKLLVDKYLARLLPPPDHYPETIHQAMHYGVFVGGKRIRPILVLATGEALKGDFQKLIYLASAIEMIHAYSLIHDDLPAMDDDDYRRGQPTVHKKFDEAIAILAGNALLTRAFQVLTEIPSRPEENETKIRVIHELCEAIGTSQGMLAGQTMDCLSQGKPFSKEQLERIHSAKTGALIAASVSCSALLSTASPQAYRGFHSFGTKIGLAFQIVDDILDVEGSLKEARKTAGKDNRNRKATYPRMYGLEASREMAAQLVEEAIRQIEFLGSDGETLRQLSRFIASRTF